LIEAQVDNVCPGEVAIAGERLEETRGEWSIDALE
jgi:hypothetical protein